MSGWTDSTGSQTATISTEHTIATPTAAGEYEFQVDTSNMVNGDLLEVRCYSKVDSSNYRQLWKRTYQHVQTNNAKVLPRVGLVGAGLKYTLLQVAGTGRAFPWSVRNLSTYAADVTQYGGSNGTFSGGRPEVNATHAAGTAWNSGAIGAATLAADTITAAKIATDAIGAAELAADAATEIATAVWAATTRILTANTNLNDLSAAGVRSAVGLASANLDTQLSGINSKTTNLPSDPADASDIAAAFGTVNSTLATIAGYIDTEVAAIKAKTDLIPGTIDGKSFIEIVTLIASVLLGKASGLATTTAVFRSLDDAKDRVTATVDTSGNRTAVTLDAT